MGFAGFHERSSGLIKKYPSIGFMARCLTKKAEPPPTRDVNRDSGTASANGGWLRRLVRRRFHGIFHVLFQFWLWPMFRLPFLINRNLLLIVNAPFQSDNLLRTRHCAVSTSLISLRC